MESPKTWVILIGIHFYRRNKNLIGATRDVENLKTYLQESKDVLELSTFIAYPSMDPPNNNTNANPIGCRSKWPTYQNITDRLDEVTKNVKSRDVVYIHYSGHGTREPIDSEQQERYHDIALVLFDETRGERYLLGADLADRLETMAERGVSITVTLDCCCSGSITRGTRGIAREVDWDPQVAAAYPPKSRPPRSNDNSIVRNAYWTFDWLKKSCKFTIMTACAAHEVAQELTDENEIKHGALTYYLLLSLDLLRKQKLQINVQSLYTRLCMRFRADWNKQTPMLLGRRDSSFIGDLCPPTPVYIGISKVGDALCLNAGRAHGISKDDEFDVYPVAPCSPDLDPSCKLTPLHLRPIRVRATAVGCLESTLTALRSTTDQTRIRTTWVAKPLKRFSRQSIQVALIDAVASDPNIVAALEANPNLMICRDSALPIGPHVYKVKMNPKQEYEILNCKDNGIPGLNPISTTEANAGARTVECIEKVALSKILELWENEDPAPDLEEGFKIIFQSSPSKEGPRTVLDPDDTGLIRVVDGEILHVNLYNCCNRTLYFHVYNIQPDWGIHGVFPKGGGADYHCLQPKKETSKDLGTSRIPLKVSIPDGFPSQGECTETLKFFVTYKATSFAIHQMEGLPAPKDARRGGPLEFQDDWATRTYRFCLLPREALINV